MIGSFLHALLSICQPFLLFPLPAKRSITESDWSYFLKSLESVFLYVSIVLLWFRPSSFITWCFIFLPNRPPFFWPDVISTLSRQSEGYCFRCCMGNSCKVLSDAFSFQSYCSLLFTLSYLPIPPPFPSLLYILTDAIFP